MTMAALPEGFSKAFSRPSGCGDVCFSNRASFMGKIRAGGYVFSARAPTGGAGGSVAEGAMSGAGEMRPCDAIGGCAVCNGRRRRASLAY